MAASLTANPNPVAVWGNTTRNTTITWSTGNADRARLYMTIAVSGKLLVADDLIDGDPATGSLSGSFLLNVSANKIYSLTLRRVSDNAVLESIYVSVYDAKEGLLAQAAMGAALQQQINPRQAIYDLSVTAGVDTCRVRFKTVQPTIPSVTARTQNGIVLQRWFPLFGGMRTEHQVLLGETDALPQDTEIVLTLIAAGHTEHNNSMEAVETSYLRTGSRDVFINFQQIEVRKDGDGGLNGEGEFGFTFGAGDAQTKAPMGEPWPSLDQDISDDEPPVKTRATIRIERGPRKLWVQVVGLESDPSVGGIVDGRRPVFEQEGSSFFSNWRYDRATVSRVFDIAGLGHQASIPMVLATGDFDVAFTVRGRINIQLKPGRSPSHFSFSEWVEGGRVTQLPEAGSLGKLSPKKFALDRDPGGKVEGHIVAKAADGSLHRQVIEAARPWRPDAGWMPAAPAVEGIVTAVLTAPDRIALFAVDPAGAVLRADPRHEDRPAEWRSLGGRFAGAVAAVARNRSIELVAHDAEGAVFHRTVTADGEAGADWQRVGAGVQGEPLAVALDAESFAVFALGHRGQVLMKRNRGGRWQSRDWQVIEGATGTRLGVAALEGEGIALAVVGRDQTLTLLTARDESGLTPKAWKPQGDLQAWLTRDIAPPSVPAAAKKKPAKKQRPRIAA